MNDKTNGLFIIHGQSTVLYEQLLQDRLAETMQNGRKFYTMTFVGLLW